MNPNEICVPVAGRVRELVRAETSSETPGYAGLSPPKLVDFCFSVSHDLSEPLRGARCYLELLSNSARPKLSGEELQWLDTAQESVLQLSRLIQGLQELVKTGAAEPLSIAPVDCAAVVKTALSLMHLAIREAGASITVERLPVIESHEPILLQVFENLVGNALKYRSVEPLRIRIFCESTHREWRFAVSDNGIGIDPRHLEYIFQPLKRLNRRHSPGAGLGLTVSRHALQRLGGRIWVESGSGAGSTFYLAIPRPSV